MSTLESAVDDLTAFHMACDVPILPSPTVPPQAFGGFDGPTGAD